MVVRGRWSDISECGDACHAYRIIWVAVVMIIIGVLLDGCIGRAPNHQSFPAKEQLSHQLLAVVESVDQVRLALDRVFIGRTELQTIELRSALGDQPISVEDLFEWIESFARDEGPRLLEDGTKFAIHFSFVLIAQHLQHLVRGVYDPSPFNPGLPPGFRTFRVHQALHKLDSELLRLTELAMSPSH